jgi:hypothetical protein
MAKHFTLFGFLLFTLAAEAQNDSLPKPQQTQQPPLRERITSARKELIASFQADDPAGAALWRDSLMKLESDTRVALVWDERWLLYYWEESYGNLFDEVERLDQAERQRLADKVPPPRDSLFELLDRRLYETRYQVYDKIHRGFLTEEEKLFALLEFDYLLRLHQEELASGEWNKRLDAFTARFPQSRFNNYIKANLYAPVVRERKARTDRGGSLDLLFFSGRWRGNELERTLRSPYGFELGLSYWTKGWNLGLRSIFTWQKLSQPIFQEGFEWPKGDPTVIIAPYLEVGYDVINTPKIRCFPSALAGLSILKPPTPDEENDNPPPDYYSNFSFVKGYLGLAFTADIKLKQLEEQDLEELSLQNSYVAARIRVGYNWLNWGDTNSALRGDMFFFAVGVNLFGN